MPKIGFLDVNEWPTRQERAKGVLERILVHLVYLGMAYVSTDASCIRCTEGQRTVKERKQRFCSCYCFRGFLAGAVRRMCCMLFGTPLVRSGQISQKFHWNHQRDLFKSLEEAISRGLFQTQVDGVCSLVELLDLNLEAFMTTGWPPTRLMVFNTDRPPKTKQVARAARSILGPLLPHGSPPVTTLIPCLQVCRWWPRDGFLTWLDLVWQTENNRNSNRILRTTRLLVISNKCFSVFSPPSVFSDMDYPSDCVPQHFEKEADF